MYPVALNQSPPWHGFLAIGFGFLQPAVRAALLVLGASLSVYLAVSLSPPPNTGLFFILGLVGT